jgi:hypothetical protein
MMGLLAGGAARFAAAPEDAPRHHAERVGSFVSVAGVEGAFPTLEAALANAPAGAVLTLHGPGPFRAETLQADELTLRAAPGNRPVIEAGADGWQPLLSGRTLILEGLALRAGEGAGPMIEATRRLVMHNCVVSSKRGGPAVSLRGGAGVRLEECRIDAAGPALAVEAGVGRTAAELHGCDVRSPESTAVVMWGEGRAALHIGASRVRAARILGVRSPLAAEVTVAGSRLDWMRHSATLDGRPMPPGAVTWRGVGPGPASALQRLAGASRIP